MIGEGITVGPVLAAIDGAADIIFCAAQDGRIVYANNAATQLLGYSAEELAGSRIQDIDTAAAATGALRAAHFRRKDGSVLSVEVSRGDSEGFACYVARVGVPNREAAADLEELGRLARHDLREPVRAITTFSDLLCDDLGGALPAAARRDLDFMLAASRRMERLLNGVAGFLRVDRVEMNIERVELNACADAAIAALGAAVLESQAYIRLETLPLVDGDTGLLKQLFQQLLANALRFRSARRPEVRIHAERREGQLTILVSDNGIGIPAEQREKVFQPFQRCASDAGDNHVGVGLAVCRKIVHRLGGRIWIEPQPGPGCTVCFTLGGCRGESV